MSKLLRLCSRFSQITEVLKSVEEHMMDSILEGDKSVLERY